MPIDATIPLMFQPPTQVNPLDSLAKVLQIKGAIAQQQLIPGQLQAQQMENQQRQNDLNEYQGFKNAMAKHGGDFEAAAPDILSAAPRLGTSFLKTLTENKKNIAETNKANADAQKAQIDAHDKSNQMVMQAMQGMGDVPPENQQAEYLNRLAMLHTSGVPTDKLPPVYDPAKLAGWKAQATTIQQVIDQSKQKIAEAEEARKVAMQPDVARETAAKATSAEAEAVLSTAKANLTKLTPDQWGAQAKAVTQGTSPAYQSMIQSRLAFAAKAGDVEGAKKILDEAAEYAAAPGKAAAVSAAEVPSRISAAVQTEIAKSRLAPGAVAGIMDPVLQRQAITEANKANDEYQGKVGDAQRLQQFVDASRSGNQAASAMIPIAEVREIVNRVNSQELQAAGGGVSMWRKVSNWAATAAEGKPTDATLSDIEQLGKMMQGAADRTRRGKLQGINTNMGAKFPLEAPEVPAAAAGGGTVNMKAPDGTVRPVPAAQVDHYKKLGATVVQ